MKTDFCIKSEEKNFSSTKRLLNLILLVVINSLWKYFFIFLIDIVSTFAMQPPLTDYLDSNELRILTGRASSHLQVEYLRLLGVPFELDMYDCPLVRYQDAKQYFLLSGKPLPRGLAYQS